MPDSLADFNPSLGEERFLENVVVMRLRARHAK